MKILNITKIAFLMLLPQVGYYLSLLYAGYFFTGTYILSSFFLIISPFPISIYVGMKFGNSFPTKIGLAALCLALAFTSLNYRLLPREVYMPPFVIRCKSELNHDKLEEFRIDIMYKYYSGTLELKDASYRFWGVLSTYVADSEKSEYIKDNFVEVGFKIKDERIDKIYFLKNKNLWGIIYIPPKPYVLSSRFRDDRSDSWHKKNLIFGDYYGFKR